MSSKFLQTLILASVLALASSPARGQEDSTSFSYDFSTGQRPATLSLDGDAHFALRMTKTGPTGNALPNSFSRIQHADPIRFRDAGGRVADFETAFKFFIRPNPGDDNPGNGFFFLIEPVGSPFPFGGKNSSVLVAEFDPSARQIAVDVGPDVSRNTKVDDLFLAGEEVTAILDYDRETKVLRSRAIAGGRVYEVSLVIDLSFFFPEIVQVGIAAATTERVAVHELSSWNFTSALVRNAGIRQYV